MQCNDFKPYDSTFPAPTADELASDLLASLEPGKIGRLADRFWEPTLCQSYAKALSLPRKSRYSGDFVLKNSTLKHPVLLLSWVFRSIISP
jgi:hypothetical protein